MIQRLEIQGGVHGNTHHRARQYNYTHRVEVLGDLLGLDAPKRQEAHQENKQAVVHNPGRPALYCCKGDAKLRPGYQFRHARQQAKVGSARDDDRLQAWRSLYGQVQSSGRAVAG